LNQGPFPPPVLPGFSGTASLSATPAPAKKRSLFPSGLLQVRDVLENGYWHARSLDYLGSELPRLLEWLRLPGDLVFIFLGALPILVAVGLGYLSLWSERPQAGATRPVRAA